MHTHPTKRKICCHKTKVSKKCKRGAPLATIQMTCCHRNSYKLYSNSSWRLNVLWLMSKMWLFLFEWFFPFLVKLLRAVTSFWLSVNGKLLIRRTTFLIWVDYSNNELSSQNTLCRHWLFSDNNLKADVQLWRTTITTTVARFHFSFWLFIFHSICWCDATKWRKWK